MYAYGILKVAWENTGYLTTDMHLDISNSLTALLLKGFPGGPVAETLCSQRRGPGFNSWSGE